MVFLEPYMLEASVIVPTRDRPAYLRTTLESLARQNIGRSSYEIIVVDDGPSRSTRDVAENVARITGARIGYVAVSYTHLTLPTN